MTPSHHTGIISSQSSVMEARRTYNLMMVERKSEKKKVRERQRDNRMKMITAEDGEHQEKTCVKGERGKRRKRSKGCENEKKGQGEDEKLQSVLIAGLTEKKTTITFENLSDFLLHERRREKRGEDNDNDNDTHRKGCPTTVGDLALRT